MRRGVSSRMHKFGWRWPKQCSEWTRTTCGSKQWGVYRLWSVRRCMRARGAKHAGGVETNIRNNPLAMSKTRAKVEAAVMIERVEVNNPEEKQEIIGQGNFSIFACDDLFKALLTTVPAMKCAVAMNEVVPRLTRVIRKCRRQSGIATSVSISASTSLTCGMSWICRKIRL